jgi:hypothetical protein
MTNKTKAKLKRVLLSVCIAILPALAAYGKAHLENSAHQKDPQKGYEELSKVVLELQTEVERQGDVILRLECQMADGGQLDTSNKTKKLTPPKAYSDLMAKP